MAKVIFNVFRSSSDAVALSFFLWHFASCFLLVCRILRQTFATRCFQSGPFIYIYIYISPLHGNCRVVDNRIQRVSLNVRATSHQLWYFDICRTFILIRKKEEKKTSNRTNHTFHTAMKCSAWTQDKIVRLSFVAPHIQLFFQFKLFLSWHYQHNVNTERRENGKCEFGRWVPKLWS